ncbi:MAG: hypothetical protein J6C77_02530 [Muribaculaceae bacterium]|nr:hypothetical protein [Muribaculaceae bacterium]
MSASRPFVKKHLRRLRYAWACLRGGYKPREGWNGPVDVVIAAIEKDLDVLPRCVEGVRACVDHPIAAIYLVAPDTEAMRQAARTLELEFVDERSLLGFTAADLKVVTADGQDRSGWIFQQLLKLAGNVGKSPHYLVIDADHILLQPHQFIDSEGRTVMYRSSEYHKPYYMAMNRLLGIDREEGLSYVAHKMLFDRRWLDRLKNDLEYRSGKAWHRAIIDDLDLTGPSPFSEYETYGHYLPPYMKVSRPWRQHTLRKGTSIPTYQQLLRRYPRKLSVTFPDYLKLSR